MASFFFQSQWNWIFVEELYTGTPAAPRPSWPLMDGQMSASQPDSAPLQTAESLKHALSGVVFDHVSGYRNPFSWTNDTCWLNRPWPLTCIYTVTMIDIPFSLMAEMPLFLFVFSPETTLWFVSMNMKLPSHHVFCFSVAPQEGPVTPSEPVSVHSRHRGTVSQCEDEEG